MNTDLEAVCVESMKRIVAIHGEQQELVDISEEQIGEAFEKIANDQIRVGSFNSGKVKYLLYNLYNLRPEFREDFESVVFKKWYEAFQLMAGDRIGFAGDTQSEQESEVEAEIEDETPELTVPGAGAPLVEQQEPEPEPRPEPEPEPEPQQEPEPEPDPEPQQEPEPEPEPEPKTSEQEIAAPKEMESLVSEKEEDAGKKVESEPEPASQTEPSPDFATPDIVEEVPAHHEEIDEPPPTDPKEASTKQQDVAEISSEPESVPDPEAVFAAAEESLSPEEEAAAPPAQYEKTPQPTAKSAVFSTGFKMRKEDLFDRFLTAVSRLMRYFIPKY